MSKKKIVSLFFLLLGLSLISAGMQDVYLLSRASNPIFSMSPDNETRAMIILGAAASVSGFVGLIRDKSIDF